MSPSTKQRWCSCVALDGLQSRFFTSILQSFFCLRICSSRLHAGTWVCFFSSWARAALPYLSRLLPHNFTLLCTSDRFTCSFWPRRISASAPPLVFFPFVRLRLLVCPLFPLHKLVSASTMCADHFALLLFGGSVCELTKKTVRSMIIASQYLWEFVRPWFHGDGRGCAGRSSAQLRCVHGLQYSAVLMKICTIVRWRKLHSRTAQCLLTFTLMTCQVLWWVRFR